jgi:Dcp1-like decapping family
MEDKHRMEEIRGKTRRIMNLKCLQKLFRGITGIAIMSKFSQVYYFDTVALIWLKCEMAGPFFVCTCSEPVGSLRLVVLNQCNNRDFELFSQNISSIKLNEAQSMIYFKMSNDEVKGVWIYDKTELLEIYTYLDALLAADKPAK